MKVTMWIVIEYMWMRQDNQGEKAKEALSRSQDKGLNKLALHLKNPGAEVG